MLHKHNRECVRRVCCVIYSITLISAKQTQTDDARADNSKQRRPAVAVGIGSHQRRRRRLYYYCANCECAICTAASSCLVGRLQNCARNMHNIGKRRRRSNSSTAHKLHNFAAQRAPAELALDVGALARAAAVAQSE